MTNPKFFWGGSIASHQCEGAYLEDGKGLAIMDLVTAGTVNKSREFHDTLKEGCYYPSHKGIDFYHKYAEDIAFFKEAGFNALRISIDWSRIYPMGDEENPNKQGLEHYKKVILELKKNNIEPIVTLFHFEIPVGIIKKYGSWENKKVVDLYLKYCETVFTEYKDSVTYWSTFNEMNHLDDTELEMTDLFTYINTGLCYSKLSDSKKTMIQCAYNMTVASAKAINLGHRINEEFQIGCILGLSPAYPYSCAPEDSIKALRDMDNDMYQIDAMTRGKFPQYKINEYEKIGVHLDMDKEDEEAFKLCHLDFIGVNYYSSKVSVSDNKDVSGDSFFGGKNNPYLKQSDWGWTIDPIGLRYILTYVDRKYSLPVIVTENGIGAEDVLEADGAIHDDYRINYLQSHINEMQKSITEDCTNCFGYLMWGPIDLISATTGEMKKRYGIIYVDQDNYGTGTQKRFKKDSFYWFRSLMEN